MAGKYPEISKRPEIIVANSGFLCYNVKDNWPFGHKKGNFIVLQSGGRAPFRNTDMKHTQVCLFGFGMGWSFLFFRRNFQ